MDTTSLTSQELGRLRRVFSFLDKSYKESELGDTRLARDLPHFYTMVTALLTSNLLDADGAPPNYPGVKRKLLEFAKLIADETVRPTDGQIAAAIEEYNKASTRQTTHPNRRAIRGQKFLEILQAL